MSIDFLFDLERAVNNGRTVYACPGANQKQWIISRDITEIRNQARRQAGARKCAVSVVRLIPPADALQGELFLVPTNIEEPGARGEPSVKWSTVETKEAAENLRDLKFGPSPFFGMQAEEEVNV
jgi:hypothetical protein